MAVNTTNEPLHPIEPWSADDLEMELPQLNASILRIDELVMEADKGEWPVPVLAVALKDLREYAGYLKDVIGSLERQVGDRMRTKQQIVEGVGTLERHRNRTMTAWKKDDLLAAVLDTRMVDPKTGELIEETPLDKVLAVFNLPAPRTSVLKDRGLQPDEFCDVTDSGGYRVVIR